MQCQEMSMCCLSTTKICYYCLVQYIIAITHCCGAVQQQQEQQQQTKYLSPVFEHQQLLSGTETSEHCSIRNSGLVSNQDLGIRNSICMDIVSIQYILQRPLTKYLRCPLSIPIHVFNVHCPYKLLSRSTIPNSKVDHSMLSNKHNSAATNVSDVEQEEYCNKAS